MKLSQSSRRRTVLKIWFDAGEGGGKLSARQSGWMEKSSWVQPARFGAAASSSVTGLTGR